MKTTLTKLLRHLAVHRELYLYPIIGLLFTWAGIVYVNSITGRAVIDDPGAIVGWLYNLMGCLLLVLIVGQTQHHLFGFRSEKANSTFRDDLFDSCVTFLLFGLFSFLLFFR